jgi:hypothetical protein
MKISMSIPAGVFRDCTELLGANLVERMVDCLRKAEEDGADTIVDATTRCPKRRGRRLKEVQSRSLQ